MHCGSKVSGLSLALLVIAEAPGTVLRVDDDALPGGDGLTWETAFDTLQDALAAAGAGDQVWVAAGTYLPDQGAGQAPGNQFAAFELVNQAAMLGGFAGGETDPDQRDPELNVTILSGDIGIPGDDSDNAYRVVNSETAVLPTTVLDGFTITGGRAVNDGGGLRLHNGDPMIVNCRIIGNAAPTSDGGGLFTHSANPTIVDCEFIDNVAGERGGGAYLNSGTLIGCVFQGNTGDHGGGLACGGSHVFTDCTFWQNTADRGGGLWNTGTITVEGCRFVGNTSVTRGGAIYTYPSSSGHTTLIDCIVVGNTAGEGAGGVHNAGHGAAKFYSCRFLGNAGTFGAGLADRGVTTVANCLFSGNVSTGPGGGLHKYGAPATIANCTFVGNSAAWGAGGVNGEDDLAVSNCAVWGNDVGGVLDEAAQIGTTETLTIDYSCVEGWTGSFGGTGNIGDDPMFVDPLGPDLILGTEDDDLRVQPGSPCIDAADNDAVPPDEFDLDGDLNTTEPLPFDLDGFTRFSDDPDMPDSGNGFAPIVDMGTFEFDGGPPPGVFTGPDGGSWFDPGNWFGGSVPIASTNVFISGEVTVDQDGAVANDITVHDGGTLNIMAGSISASTLLLESGGTLVLGHASAYAEFQTITALSGSGVLWDAGTLRLLAGGTWNNLTAPINLGCSGTGTLVVEDGANVIASTINTCTMGTIRGSGILTADVISDGRLVPGLSVGVLTIDGDYTQTMAGSLEIELNGYLPGTQFDQLLVDGAATLDGELDVVLLPGFAPELAGDQRVVRAGDLNGTFALENIPGLPGDFLFELAYDVPASGDPPRTLQLITTLTGTGPRVYVDAAAGPGGDGQSWAAATNDLTAALEFAELFPGVVSEIWVAAGVYKPGRGSGDRAASFVLVPDVAVYGGFVGNETDLEERDWGANITTLTGDLNGDDGPDFTNNEENSIHVVASTFDGNQNPVLDGFVITGGHASEGAPNAAESRGGGLYNLAIHALITNCTFTGNLAYRGGAVNDGGDYSVISNCVFTGNVAGQEGGALWTGNGLRIGCTFVDNSADWGGAVGGGSGYPIFEDCIFQSNAAYRGGAIHGESHFRPTLLRCEFVGNDGYQRGGAVHLEDAGCRLDVVDCAFVVNTADAGGAVYSAADNYSFTGCLFDWNLAMAGGAVRGGADPGWFTDCTFVNNEAFGEGGALDLGGGTTLLVNCSFQDQHAWTEGGAIRLGGGTLALFGGVFAGNVADDRGGAMALRAAATAEVYGTTFLDNSAAVFGGAVSVQSVEVSSFANCLFAGNAAVNGGALYTMWGNPELINCTVVDNAAAAGGGMFNDGTTPTITNCILWANVPESLILVEPLPVVTYSDVEGGIDGAGNIDADPVFIDRDGPDDDPATVEDNDYRLAAGSPCIDAANNLAVLECGVLDFDGLARFVDDPATADSGLGDPPIVDMGAWEYGAGPSPDDCNDNGIADTCDSAMVPAVDCDGNGLPDECEFVDCNGNGVTDQCDVLDGTSPDCNGNDIPDECDIADGPSEDCNDDGVPDECSEDCNENGVPDATDVCNGDSSDVNGNGVLDECECLADLDGNNVVNELDFLHLLSRWGYQGGSAEDINNDYVVDVVDFLLLLRFWGPCP
jgi:hypothetical protein